MMGANWQADPQEKVYELTAWWFKRTASGKRIWPGQKYVLIKRTLTKLDVRLYTD